MFGSLYKCELAHLKYSGKNQTSTNENVNKECNIAQSVKSGQVHESPHLMFCFGVHFLCLFIAYVTI